MNRLLRKKILAVILVIIGIMSVSWQGTAAEQGRGGVSKEMQKTIGLPALTGDLWQKMTEDSKIAFIWGLWQTIAIENYLMQKYPSLNKENFSAKMEEASIKSHPTVNGTVTLVDRYYRENPDHLDKPVVGVIWNWMVKPYITTGINGRPLKNQ